jgi:flavin reductase (DIM6/NTAB) family NADH-FMN oxidoreductase RutF
VKETDMLAESQPLPYSPPPAGSGPTSRPTNSRTGDQRHSPQEFAQGIGHLAGGVTVVTSSDDDGAQFGVTSTSVCSLSLDPPTLVACVPRGSRLGRDIGRTRRFCVNVLTARQRAIAETFAGLGLTEKEKFRHGDWARGLTGSPMLEDALASFECSTDLVYGYPEHLIVVGSVQNVVHSDAGDPLVYVSRQFAEVDHRSAMVAAS